MAVDPPNLDRIPTADGAVITCKRKRGPGQPVIFVHGIAVNADLWDIPPINEQGVSFQSLPDQLHALGYDIWMINLRGHGQPHMHSAPPPGQQDWTFDHYVAYDLPAVVDHVAEQSQGPVWLIGNSMGAMTIGGYLQGVAVVGDPHQPQVVGDTGLARCRQDRVRGAVLLEYPAALSWPDSYYGEDGALRWSELWNQRKDETSNFSFEWLARARFLETVIYAMGEIPLRWMRNGTHLGNWRSNLPEGLSQTLAWADEAVLEGTRWMVASFKGGQHFEPLMFTRGFLPSTDHIKAGVIAQFGKSVRARSLVSGLGAPDYDYTCGYPRIECPLLVISGGRDRIANADTLREVFFERVASPDKRLEHFPEIAHGEFEWATVACQEVYPLVLDWLAQRP